MNIKDINAHGLRQLIEVKKDDLEIIDVRDKEEFDIIKFKYSKLIPMDELTERLDEIDWKRIVIFVCRSGARSRYIGEVVGNSGKKIINLQGGIVDYYYNLDSDGCLEIDTDRIGEYV